MLRLGVWTMMSALLAAASPSAAQVVSGGPAGRGPVETDADVRLITEAERAWGRAYVTGDVAAIERLLADDFIGVDPRGRTYDKVFVLKEVRDGPHGTSDEVGPITTRFYGDTAVAQATEREIGPPPELRPVEHVFTDTWVKIGGQWRIVAAEDVTLVAP